MAEAKKGKKVKRLLGRLFGALMALLAAALIYLALVILPSPAEQAVRDTAPSSTPAPVGRMQAAAMDDALSMARMFEYRLPQVQGFSLRGEGVNTAHDGQDARLVTLRYEGFTLSAVRPASAAPLLLREGLDVSLRSDAVALSLPAVIAARGNAWCAYFSDENAAYSVYAPAAEEKTFFELLSRLSWAEP